MSPYDEGWRQQQIEIDRLAPHRPPVLPADTLRYLRDSLASGELTISVHRNDLQLILAALDSHAVLRAPVRA